MRKVFVSRTCSRNTVAKLTYQMDDDDAHRAREPSCNRNILDCVEEKNGKEKWQQQQRGWGWEEKKTAKSYI